MKGTFPPRCPRLLAITPAELSVVALPAAIERLAAAIAPAWRDHVIVLLRRPDLSVDAYRALFASLGPLIRRRGLRAGWHLAHPEAAGEALEASDWVQFPERVAAATGQLPPRGSTTRAAWARSCHDTAGVTAALDAGADFATLSPIFATPSKPGAPTLGLERLRTAATRHPDRVIPLGGIDAGNTAACIAAGATGVACIRAAWDADAPRFLSSLGVASSEAWPETSPEASRHEWYTQK